MCVTSRFGKLCSSQLILFIRLLFVLLQRNQCCKNRSALGCVLICCMCVGYRSWCPLAAGRVLVHCARGISRSATLALAYLMIRERLSLVAALELVCQHRNILPNAGFLEQLRRLDTSLQQQQQQQH